MNDEIGSQEETVDLEDVSAAADDETLTQDTGQIEQSLALSRRVEQPPDNVPGYTILKSLGDGAYGSVWLAREENTGKRVAIKFYTHRGGLDWSLLNREVEKLAVLYTSRNIVGLLDVGWDSDPPYYVMEYLENGSLASQLAGGPLPPHEAVRIGKSVLRALVHAHGSGILHCDLKPANVLLDADFSPRLGDFGQSRLSDEQDPALGTLFYMAPEQADLKAVPDARWDVYALGALLYQMLCGEPPFHSPENERLIHAAETLEDRLAVYRRILKESPKPNRHRKMPGVDKRLADIVDRCLHVKPERRYPNAQAVLDILELRDRQRSRRPLVALGILGPVVLLSTMIPFARDAMKNAENDAREHLTARALESDMHSARILALSLERELEDRKSELRDVAADAEVRKAVREFARKPLPEREDSMLFKVLHERKSAAEQKHHEQNREPDTSWFLNDDEGFQRWREPLIMKVIDRNWARRDYFHGRGRDYAPDSIPDDIAPLREPHISIPFVSRATGRYMVAITVPIWEDVEKKDKVIGVLGRTTHLGHLLAAYGRRIHSGSADDADRMIALVDSREWRLLDHPWIAKQGNLRSLPEETFDKLRLSGRIVEKLTRLQQGGPAADGAGPNDRDDSYSDPVRHIDESTYGGEWLAAFAPVGNTTFLAIVQERKDTALQPVEEMGRGLSRHGSWALGVGCGLILLLWYGVQRALNDRSLRIRVRGSSPRTSQLRKSEVD
jgi:serine/threonine protein kinase